MENQQSQQNYTTQPARIMNVEKYVKRIKSAGTWSIVYGVLVLIASFFLTLMILSVASKEGNFLYSIGVIPAYILGIVFIIIGKKIKQKTYNSSYGLFIVVIVLNIILMIFYFQANAAISLFNILFLIAFIIGILALKKIKSQNI